jgi:hypothetical protein
LPNSGQFLVMTPTRFTADLRPGAVDAVNATAIGTVLNGAPSDAKHWLSFARSERCAPNSETLTLAVMRAASGQPYPWAEVDRKYVIRPPLDYSLAYPVALADPD